MGSKLSIKEKVAYSAGDMSINVMVAAMFFFISYFYTDIYGLDPMDMGILFLAARVFDAITDPLMGLLTDRVRTRWGQYRHYFLILAVPYGLSVMLLFTTPDWDYNYKLVWAYATYLLVTLFFTGLVIPYISYAGVITSDPEERLSASTYRMFFAKIASILVVTLVPLLAKFIDGEESGSHGYRLSMWFVSGLGITLMLFCFAGTKERVVHDLVRTPLKTQIQLLLKNDQWMVLCGAAASAAIGFTLRSSVALYYAIYYLGCTESIAGAFVSAGLFSSIFAMVASSYITDKYCKIAMFKWSQLCVGALSVFLYLVVSPGEVVLAFFLYGMLCFIADLHAPVFWSSISESIDYGHRKDGCRVTGLSVSGITFFQKVGGGVAGLMAGFLLSAGGYVGSSDVQPPAALHNIVLMFTIIPGVFHALMGLFMFKYKITSGFYKNMMCICNDTLNSRHS